MSASFVHFVTFTGILVYSVVWNQSWHLIFSEEGLYHFIVVKWAVEVFKVSWYLFSMSRYHSLVLACPGFLCWYHFQSHHHWIPYLLIGMPCGWSFQIFFARLTEVKENVVDCALWYPFLFFDECFNLCLDIWNQYGVIPSIGWFSPLCSGE